MQTNEHSILSPSSAHRFMNCSAAPSREFKAKDNTGPAAEEGTAAHFVAAQLIHGEKMPDIAPNDWPISSAMIENVLPYVEDIAAVTDQPLVEEFVCCTSVHPDCFGTSDAAHYDFKTNTLHVWDLKYGWSIVEPENNWQLVTYASGMLDRIPQKSLDMTIVLTIAQPRPPHFSGRIRRWTLTYEEIRPYIDQLNVAASRAMGENTELSTGKHCLYCKALYNCPAAYEASTNALSVVGMAPFDFEENIGAELALLLDAESIIKTRVKALEAEITTRGGCNEWSVEPKLGREKWASSYEKMTSLADLFGVDIRKPGLITPKQAINKGLKPELVRANSKVESSGTKLVPKNQSIAHKVFGGN